MMVSVRPTYVYSHVPQLKQYILSLTNSLSVDQFLLALRRFVSHRGLPVTVWSDNAKTFKSSARELLKIMKSSKTQQYLSKMRVDWKFIVDRAPWWGGFWERMVRSVKRCLHKCIGRTSLMFDAMTTLLVKIEAVINNRPLFKITEMA